MLLCAVKVTCLFSTLGSCYHVSNTLFAYLIHGVVHIRWCWFFVFPEWDCSHSKSVKCFGVSYSLVALVASSFIPFSIAVEDGGSNHIFQPGDAEVAMRLCCLFESGTMFYPRDDDDDDDDDFPPRVTVDGGKREYCLCYTMATTLFWSFYVCLH